MKRAKVAIIGGGVSGISAAILVQDHAAVTIFERENDVLLKLLKTGNGRANIYNRAISVNAYNDQTFMARHYALIEPTLDDLFKQLNILTYTDESLRVYPYSRSARGLKEELLKKVHARLCLNTNVTRITPQGSGFLVNDENFDYVFVTTGSSAGLFKRSIANDNENLFASCALEVTSFTPVIKTIKVQENLHAIKHERVDAALTLYRGNEKLARDRGEILFKADGLSGIVSFVLSSYVEWASEHGGNLSLALDFMPDHSAAEVAALLRENGGLSHIFAPRVATFLEQSKKKDKVAVIKNYVLTPLSGNYPENAQAMHGGVSLGQIDDNFALKTNDRFFVLGEALNVDGICGGYNLGFAFYSAVRASNALLDKLSKHT